MIDRIHAAALREVMEALSSGHNLLRARILCRLDSLDLDGGPGSGNWGHAGRPGMRGGSMPGGGTKNRMPAEGGGYTSAAKQRKAAKKAGQKPEKSEAERYAELRTDAKNKWKEYKEAEAEVRVAKYRIEYAEMYGKPAPEDAEKTLAEWEPKMEERHGEYEELLKAAGVTTPTEETLFRSDIQYNPAQKLDTPRSEEEIIKRLCGGDETGGSCVSLALAYVGQKRGLDVLDYRGGNSLNYFQFRKNHLAAIRDCGGNVITSDSAKTAVTNVKRLLAQMEEGKQYYLTAGQHVSIVRIKDGRPQYLELQHPYDGNGWQNFNTDVAKTLRIRFGSGSKKAATDAQAVDIDQIGGEDFRRILGYINTNVNEQRKGSKGSVR